jgi:hypothetical protein
MKIIILTHKNSSSAQKMGFSSDFSSSSIEKLTFAGKLLLTSKIVRKMLLLSF